MIDHYDWAGGREAMLRFGPATGPVVIAALPLFEEANRTRTFVVSILRLLADKNIVSALPDLPGTGESEIDTENVLLSNWNDAFSSAIDCLDTGLSVHILAVRGGALIAAEAIVASRYHLAPASGAALVRDLIRTRQAAAAQTGDRFDPDSIVPPGPPIEIAGTSLSRAMIAELQGATPATSSLLRTIRLDSDTGPADRKLPGVPLWRRSEPGVDPTLAALIADDLAGWITTCGS